MIFNWLVNRCRNSNKFSWVITLVGIIIMVIISLI